MFWFFANKYFMEISFTSTNIYFFMKSQKNQKKFFSFHYIIHLIKNLKKFINKINDPNWD